MNGLIVDLTLQGGSSVPGTRVANALLCPLRNRLAGEGFELRWCGAGWAAGIHPNIRLKVVWRGGLRFVPQEATGSGGGSPCPDHCIDTAQTSAQC